MAKLDSAQLEQLREIGAYLHQVRQSMSKPIEDVAAEIFIRASLIRAIEEGDADTLPEPVFIQGFIRRYGEALGLDGVALSKEFVVQPVGLTFAANTASAANTTHSSQADQSSPSSDTVAAEPEEVATLEPAVLPVAPAPGVTRPRAPIKLPVMPIAIAGVAVIVIGGAIALLQNAGSQSPTSAEGGNNTPTTETSEANQTSGDTADVVPSDSGATPTPNASSPSPDAEPEAPIVVSVNLSGDAWMSVTADGDSVYEGTLSEGAEETWTAEREIRITTGNAGAVSLSHNGSEASPVGPPGSVETLTFTASN